MTQIARIMTAGLLVGVGLALALAAPFAHGSSPGGFSGVPSGSSVLTSIAPTPQGGLWRQQDGSPIGVPRSGTYLHGAGGAYPSVDKPGTVAALPGGEAGYFVVTWDGEIHAVGDAKPLSGGKLSNGSGFPSRPTMANMIVAAAAANDAGLWAVGRDGKVWTAGDAVSYGDVQGENRIPTAIFGTPSGKGYTILLDDGGVFTFGDAKFFGSTGGKKPGGQDATGLTPSYDATGKHNGYWMVFEDGGVHTFGDAPFLGSTGGHDGGSKVTGITTLHGGKQYAWVHADGTIEYSRVAP